MKSQTTKGIVLGRINYGEADRILTIITPDYGKLRAIAKGVRKEKSKLAGGIELFTISNISFIPGKRDISTLVSTRLDKNFGNIVKDLPRTTLGYQALKTVDKVTEDECGAEYFELLGDMLGALHDPDINLAMVESWFYMRLLKLMGHEPNLQTDSAGDKLEVGAAYGFDYDSMSFIKHPTGKYSDKHIKLMRLMLIQPPKKVSDLAGIDKLPESIVTLLRPVMRSYVG